MPESGAIATTNKPMRIFSFAFLMRNPTICTSPLANTERLFLGVFALFIYLLKSRGLKQGALRMT